MINERSEVSFSKNLRPSFVDDLEADKDVVYGLTEALRFNYFNPSWFKFAAVKGGEPNISNSVRLGTDLRSFLDQEIRDFYVSSCQEVIKTGKIWKHEYQCSSPTLYRSMMQTVYPVPNNGGLIVVNSLVVEVPIAERFSIVYSPVKDSYVDAKGLICQCVHCRKAKNRVRDSWDYVPTWVEKMPLRVRFSFCPPCKEHYGS